MHTGYWANKPSNDNTFNFHAYELTARDLRTGLLFQICVADWTKLSVRLRAKQGSIRMMNGHSVQYWEVNERTIQQACACV